MSKWFNKFFEEKNIDLEDIFEINGNIMSYGVIVEHINIAPANEQASIKKMLVKIDFVNGDIRDYLRHLGKAIAL